MNEYRNENGNEWGLLPKIDIIRIRRRALSFEQYCTGHRTLNWHFLEVTEEEEKVDAKLQRKVRSQARGSDGVPLVKQITQRLKLISDRTNYYIFD